VLKIKLAELFAQISYQVSAKHLNFLKTEAAIFWFKTSAKPRIPKSSCVSNLRKTFFFFKKHIFL